MLFLKGSFLVRQKGRALCERGEVGVENGGDASVGMGDPEGGQREEEDQAVVLDVLSEQRLQQLWDLLLESERLRERCGHRAEGGAVLLEAGKALRVLFLLDRVLCQGQLSSHGLDRCLVRRLVLGSCGGIVCRRRRWRRNGLVCGLGGLCG